jgi:hypothetical protein
MFGAQNNHFKDRDIPYPLDVIKHLLCNFPGKICKFPSKYLGLPLHVRKLRKIEVQPLIDKIGLKLPGWKGRLLSTAGRESLVKTVLTAQPSTI